MFRTKRLQSFYLPVIKERTPFETNVSASSTAWCRDARLAVLVKALLIIPTQALFFLSVHFKLLLLWKFVYMLVNRQEQAFRKRQSDEGILRSGVILSKCSEAKVWNSWCHNILKVNLVLGKEPKKKYSVNVHVTAALPWLLLRHTSTLQMSCCLVAVI